MVFVLPTDNELRNECEQRVGDHRDAEATLRDSAWSITFTQAAETDPADVHGA